MRLTRRQNRDLEDFLISIKDQIEEGTFAYAELVKMAERKLKISGLSEANIKSTMRAMEITMRTQKRGSPLIEMIRNRDEAARLRDAILCDAIVALYSTIGESAPQALLSNTFNVDDLRAPLAQD